MSEQKKKAPSERENEALSEWEEEALDDKLEDLNRPVQWDKEKEREKEKEGIDRSLQEYEEKEED
jgi:hypothetical protein